MAIAVRQTKSYTLIAEDSTTTCAFDSAILAGSAILIIGGAIDSSAGEEVLITSATDTGSNTWSNMNNAKVDQDWFANAFGIIAKNCSSGSPTVTLNWDKSTVKCTFSMLEITGQLTSTTVDMVKIGLSADGATSSSTAATGTLTQANNLLVLAGTGFFGIPTNPSGWTNVATVQNGASGGGIGAQISYKTTSSTSTVTGTITHEAASYGTSMMMYVIKEAAAGATIRYKFQFDTSKMTTADTGITGYVWRNTTPDVGTAEKYTSLAGDATAGDLIVTSVAAGAQVGDSITGLFSNGTDTSGIVTGAVESV